MPPSGECLRRIAPTAAMVDKFEQNTQNTTKTQLLASNYGTFRSLVVCENFNPKTDPLLSSSMWQASCKCEMPRLELKSSQTFLAIKRCEGTKIRNVIKQSRSSIYKLAHICTTRGIPDKSFWATQACTIPGANGTTMVMMFVGGCGVRVTVLSVLFLT
jgi:hypothetical protein